VTETAPDSDEGLAPSARPSARWRVGLGAAIVLAVLGVGVAVVAGILHSGGGLETVAAATPSGGSAITPAPTTPPPSVIVHVLGQVTAPGVYELPPGSRIIDAVGAAAGFAAAADQGALNLAAPLSDGEQIYVPKPGEQPPPAASTGAGAAPAPQSGGGAAAAGAKVDLNTATLEQLETLPRVGPALGQRILDWRAQNGRFATVDDLKNVTGIGDKTFADLKDLVSAG